MSLKTGEISVVLAKFFKQLKAKDGKPLLNKTIFYYAMGIQRYIRVVYQRKFDVRFNYLAETFDDMSIDGW